MPNTTTLPTTSEEDTNLRAILTKRQLEEVKVISEEIIRVYMKDALSEEQKAQKHLCPIRTPVFADQFQEMHLIFS